MPYSLRSIIRSHVIGFFFLATLLMNVGIIRAMDIRDIHPTRVPPNQPFQLRIEGEGFGDRTRVTLYRDIGNRNAIIGSAPIADGSALRVSISGNLAYVAAYRAGMWIFDISDPRNPRFIGSAPTSGYAYDVSVFGSIACVAALHGGLEILDVSNPSAPEVIGIWKDSSKGNLRAVEIAGTRAIVAAGAAGIHVVYIGDPKNPQYMATVSIPGGYAEDLKVDNFLAVVAARDAGIQIISLADSQNPQILASAPTHSAARAISIWGNYAFVAGHHTFNSEMEIFDLGNSLESIGRVPIPGSAYGVSANNGVAMVAATRAGLQMVDVSDIFHPRRVGGVSTPVGPWGVTIGDNGLAYAADRTGGLQLIDIKQINKNSMSLPNKESGFGIAVDIDDDVVFLADSDFGLVVFDVSNRYMHKKIAEFPINHIRDLKIKDGYLYVATLDDFRVLDVGNPSSPRLAAVLDDMRLDSLSITENLVISTFGTRFHVIDVSDPEMPKVVGGHDTLGWLEGIAVSGTTVCVVSRDAGLELFNLDVPSAPLALGRVLIDGAQAVTIADGFAYVADGNHKAVQIVDIRMPDDPVLIGTCPLRSLPRTISVVDGTAYAGNSSGVVSMDISDPFHPVVIGESPTWNLSPPRLVVSSDTAFVADRNNALCSLQVPMVIEGSIAFIGTNEIILDFPPQMQEGNYSLRVFDDGKSFEATGRIRVETPAPVPKAIIVAAGGPDGKWQPDIWKETRRNANLAFNALHSQGYSLEDIYYFSFADEWVALHDGTAINPVNEKPVEKLRLEWAITEWATNPIRPADSLVIYLMSHGGREKFYLSPTEHLSPEDMKTWLDSLDLPGRIIVVMESCYSGSFFPGLHPEEPRFKDREWIVVTSTASDREAVIMNSGQYSFSYQFWSRLRCDGNLQNAFEAARKLVASMKPENHQSPKLDANGNGIPFEEEDFSISNDTCIGSCESCASLLPVIADASVEVLDGNKLLLKAGPISSPVGVSEVRAVIAPPCYNRGQPGMPITHLPVVSLIGPSNDGLYSAIYDDFIYSGTYQITLLAGYPEEGEIVMSEPQSITIINENGMTCVRGDLNADGTCDLSDALIALQVLAGLTPSIRADYPTSGVDVDHDGRVALAEAIYALRKVAEIE